MDVSNNIIGNDAGPQAKHSKPSGQTQPRREQDPMRRPSKPPPHCHLHRVDGQTFSTHPSVAVTWSRAHGAVKQGYGREPHLWDHTQTCGRACFCQTCYSVEGKRCKSATRPYPSVKSKHCFANRVPKHRHCRAAAALLAAPRSPLPLVGSPAHFGGTNP